MALPENTVLKYIGLECTELDPGKPTADRVDIAEVEPYRAIPIAPSAPPSKQPPLTPPSAPSPPPEPTEQTEWNCNNVYDSGPTPLVLDGTQSGHTDFPSPVLGSSNMNDGSVLWPKGNEPFSVEVEMSMEPHATSSLILVGWSCGRTMPEQILPCRGTRTTTARGLASGTRMRR